ncbi:hypothetical protein LJR290_007740 [Variovorax sp. LjRoot290]
MVRSLPTLGSKSVRRSNGMTSIPASVLNVARADLFIMKAGPGTMAQVFF